ncbi:hypothetical protein QFZ79_003893 [Arthrobacter sp. V4I6]|uniref:hypothetical protein n=1 Tax=unclassified Arthrobacter TaxID=235627 RepID=UPI00278925D5|nr:MULTISPECIES: hypothetical protein [unclassified Arthrobacter]MDQ0821517.1 hypothetical protein [Arthrobacter sp. V1I7]MDQ0855782.1 hypothetical protein [Arthrobacter sp. V4I6]
MSYEERLTFNLRVRGLPEPEIAEVLDEVRAHEAATGTAAEAEFGAAEEYAMQFPKQKSRTRGKYHYCNQPSLGCRLCHQALDVVLAILGVDIRELVGPVTLLPGTGLILAGLLAGFLTDYFQPAQRSLTRQL